MSNIIDSIQLSGTVYTIQGSGGGGGGTVESAITSGSTNAVESKAIYDATHIDSFDLWTATDSNNYNNNTQSLYKVYVQYTGDTALDEQVQVEIYYGSNFTREAITGNVYQETASTSSVFTSTFDNGKWIIESSSPNYIRSVYADYRFKIWVFIRAISDNFAADSIKDDIIPYINDVDTIARNAVTGGNLHQGDSNKELRLLLQKGNGGSTSSVMNLDDLKCSYNGTLSTDIQIPTGEIGWTEITPQNNCTAGNMPTNKVKVTYSGQTVSADYRRLQFNAVFATNVNTDYYRVNINWSNTTTPTVNGCSAVTATYDSTDDSVTIELPTGETTYNGSTGTFSIENLRNIYCQFGTGISSVKYYGDITEDIYTAMAHKQNTLSAGTGIEISGNVISATGGGGSSYSAGTGIDITNDVISVTGKADTSAVTAIQDSLSGYVTTDTLQTISGRKVFTYSSSSSKAIEFKQTSDTTKLGFSIKNSASTNNEVASFEFRPNTFTIDGVQHPLMYFGHYRNNNTANAGVPQTVIGFRQYDQKNAAAYHYLMPLPEKAKTPFSLTTSFKDYYAPMGFKVDSGGTMVTTDNTGVVDLSSYLGGGGSDINVVQTTGTSTADVMSQSAVTTQLNNKANSTAAVGGYRFGSTSGVDFLQYTNVSRNDIGNSIYYPKINGKGIFTNNSIFAKNNYNFQLVETSAITTSITSSSTDAQVPSAKAVYDQMGGLSLVKLTQAQYDALSPNYDSNTLYVIVN